MTPMQSANIAHAQGQQISKGMEGGSRICTHSGNSKTKMGVSSLNHCNTTSPLNSDCMEAGSMTYAYQAMDAALDLLLGEEEKEKAEETKTMTYKEFVEANDGATKAQFILYVRNRLNKELETEPEPEPESEPAEMEIPYFSADPAEIPYFSADPAMRYQQGDIRMHKHLDGTDVLKMLDGENWREIPNDLHEVNTAKIMRSSSYERNNLKGK